MKKFHTSLVCIILSIIFIAGCTSDPPDTNVNNAPSLPSYDEDTQGGSSNVSTPDDEPSGKNEGNSQNSDSLSPPISSGAVTHYNFNKSGTVRSNTGTNLNLYISWTAVSNDGKTLKVKFTVGIESYSIQVGARPHLGKFQLDGKSYTFSTEALIIADNRKKVNTDFYSFEQEYEFLKGDAVSFDVSASWVFNGVYGGTPLQTLVAADTVTLQMPK